MAGLSRRKISGYVADKLIGGRSDVLSELAAYLLETKRTKELELIVRDIEDALAARGVVVADVTSARSLTEQSLKALEQFVTQESGASTVTFRQAVDESVIGGVRLALPGREMDATVRRKLTTLKTSKV